MSDELKALALELKGHAWLSRFRNASYGNKQHVQSPQHANDIAGHVDKFIDAVLARLEADEKQAAEDALPVTEKWLNGNYSYNGAVWRVGSLVEIHRYYQLHGNYFGVDLGSFVVKLKSIRQLRQLIEALETK